MLALDQQETPWFADYEPRSWKQYAIGVDARSEQPPTVPCEDFVVCALESLKAALHWRDQQAERPVSPAFYYDAEQLLGADFDEVSALHPDGLGRLSEDWNGHPKGTLVMLTYKGCSGPDPMKFVFTYLVEVQSES